MGSAISLPSKNSNNQAAASVATVPAEESDRFVASEWKPLRRNTLVGFFTIGLPSGLRIHELSVHERDGARWITFPSRPWKKTNGEQEYATLIEIPHADSRRDFQVRALAALDELLASEGGAA